MLLPNFTIYNNEIIINNISEIKSFNDKSFILKINENLYEVTGHDLFLKDVTNDNKTIKIVGTIDSLINKNKTTAKQKGFIKRLFS